MGIIVYTQKNFTLTSLILFARTIYNITLFQLLMKNQVETKLETNCYLYFSSYF